MVWKSISWILFKLSEKIYCSKYFLAIVKENVKICWSNVIEVIIEQDPYVEKRKKVLMVFSGWKKSRPSMSQKRPNFGHKNQEAFGHTMSICIVYHVVLNFLISLFLVFLLSFRLLSSTNERNGSETPENINSWRFYRIYLLTYIPTSTISTFLTHNLVYGSQSCQASH